MLRADSRTFVLHLNVEMRVGFRGQKLPRQPGPEDSRANGNTSLRGARIHVFSILPKAWAGTVPPSLERSQPAASSARMLKTRTPILFICAMCQRARDSPRPASPPGRGGRAHTSHNFPINVNYLSTQVIWIVMENTDQYNFRSEISQVIHLFSAITFCNYGAKLDLYPEQ